MTIPSGTLVWCLCLSAVLAFSLPALAGPPNDMDSDGTADVIDFCKMDPLAPNPRFCDTDMDGYGNSCDADHNNDGIAGGPDFPTFVGAFGSTGAPGFSSADHNCDGTVGAPDFPSFVNQFGSPPGPSGLACAGTITCP